MQLPASMNIAPPPETRRTTWTPEPLRRPRRPPRCAATGTSRSRRPGSATPRTGTSDRARPAASSRASTSSRAACSAGSRMPGIEVGEGVVGPAGGAPQRAADGDRDGTGVEAHHGHRDAEDALCGGPGQVGVDAGSEFADGRVRAQPAQRAVDQRQRLVGVEEEVAADPDLGQAILGRRKGRRLPACRRAPCTRRASARSWAQARRHPPRPLAAGKDGVLTSTEDELRGAGGLD